MKGQGTFNPPGSDGVDTQGSDGGGWSLTGRNLHFGVREHAMGAIVNGLAAKAFGASAPAAVLLSRYGFTIDHVVLRAHRLLAAPKRSSATPAN